MPERFKELDYKTFKSYYEMMVTLKIAGFTNEFDNSLVMRAINDKISEIWNVCNKSCGVYLLTQCQQDLRNELILKVTLRSSVLERAQETLILFVRNGRLVVSSNVIEDRVRQPQKNLAIKMITQRAYIQLERAEAAEAMTFWKDVLPPHACGLIDMTFGGLEPPKHPNQCRANLTLGDDAITAEFTVSGIAVAQIKILLTKNSAHCSNKK